MATMASDQLPDKCLICYSNVTSKQCSRGRKPINRNGPPYSPSILDRHLENIFILHNVLEIPLGNLKTYLMSWSYPDKWISLCQKCKIVIDEAKALQFEMVVALKRLKKVKERVVKMMKLSNENEEACMGKSQNNFITNQSRKFVKIHEYGDFTDPFMEGDRKAKQLAEATFISVKASLQEDINVVKSEIDSSGDFDVEDNLDFCSSDGEHDNALVGENIESKPNVNGKTLADLVLRGNDTGNSRSLNEGSTRSKNIKCNKCTRFFRPSLLSEHLRLHEKSPHNCNICGNVFHNRVDLTKHVAKYHRSVFLDYKESSRSNETRKNRKSRMENVNNEESHKTETPNWKPDTDTPLYRSTRSCSTRKRGVKNETGDKIEKTLIDCPLCGNARFRIFDGKSKKLLKHLENCEVLKGKEVNEDMFIGKNITCQLCKKISITSSEKLACFEHLLSCDGKSENYRIPLTNRIFECNICPSTRYFQFDDFVEHYMEHFINTYQCTKCPRRFPLTSKIVHHWKSQHYEAMKTIQPLCRFTKNISVPEVPWWCPVCSKKFANEDLRDSHVETDHGTDKLSKIYNCTECSMVYFCTDELKLHEKTIHAEKTGKLIKCDLCNILFSTRKQLQKHRMKKHRVDLLICDICGTECNCPASLNLHMQLHQDVKRFSCQECNQSFTTRQYLSNHKYQVHTERDPKVNPLVCPHCDRIFYSPSYLRKHISGVHQGNFKFHCHICNQGCQHESTLKRHLAIKHKIGEIKKQYACTVKDCEMAFNCRTKLNAHLSKHTGNPQFACQFCGKEFYKKESMRRHEMIHTNAKSKPFQCEICAKRFPVRNYLYIHMRSHGKGNLPTFSESK